jgi:hypothetical protein
MFKEYDVVALKGDFENVKAGTKGTIVMVYDADPPAIEVEFFSKDKKTIAVLTVLGDQLRELESGEPYF